MSNLVLSRTTQPPVFLPSLASPSSNATYRAPPLPGTLPKSPKSVQKLHNVTPRHFSPLTKLTLTRIQSLIPAYGSDSPHPTFVPYKLPSKNVRKTSGKRLDPQSENKRKHHYSTSVSTTADSVILEGSRDRLDKKKAGELGSVEALERGNAILTPSSSGRNHEDKKLEVNTSLEDELVAYSRSQLSPDASVLDYIQCETVSIPFYSVTPTRRCGKRPFSLVFPDVEFVPGRSNTPPLNRPRAKDPLLELGEKDDFYGKTIGRFGGKSAFGKMRKGKVGFVIKGNPCDNTGIERRTPKSPGKVSKRPLLIRARRKKSVFDLPRLVPSC